MDEKVRAFIRDSDPEAADVVDHLMGVLNWQERALDEEEL